MCDVRRGQVGGAGWREEAVGTDTPALRHLFEEENGLAQALLADAAQHHEQLQQKCQQLQQKRQRWARSPCPVSQGEGD